jgi:DNA-binding transcriptional MerR regulator
MTEGVLSIGEIARRTGVSASTLRAWERRYGLFEPERTAGGHRRYRLGDVERVHVMRSLLRSGWSVDAAAAHVVASGRTVERAPRKSPRAAPEPSGPTQSAAVSGSPVSATATTTATLLEAESRAGAATTPDERVVDAPAVAAAYRATIRLLSLTDPADAKAVLVAFVTEVGGAVAPADDAAEDAIPVDVSFGDGPPLLPSAPPMSLARMRLEFLLPELVEAARRMVDLLRRSGLSTGR